jgi:tetratricopeptide (TPR) repeat protein
MGSGVSGPASFRYREIIGPLQAFREAVALQDCGRLREAEQRYEIVIKADSRHFDALYRLGLIRLQQGRFGDAADLFRRALKTDRKSADAQVHLGVALAGVKLHDEAILHYKKALIIRTRFPEAHNNLGYSLQTLGRLEQAITHYKKALAINPHYIEASNNLGTALAAQGEHDAAVPHFEAALAINPNYFEARKGLANALGALDRYREAAEHYEKALTLIPDDAEVRTALGNTLHRLERPEEAIAQYERALAVSPDFVEAHNSLGNTLHFLDRSEEAIAHFQRVIAIAPNDVEAYASLGNTLVALGRMDEAQTPLAKAIVLAPRNTGCYYSLANSKRMTADNPHFAAMKELAADAASLPVAGQTDLHFALGKAFADVGDQQQSFDHVLQANALKRQQIKYNETDLLGKFDRTRNVFTAEVMSDKQGRGDPSTTPVFIVGMPRSGTTLIEQILASHPKVFGAGELREMAKLSLLLRSPEGLSYPEAVPTMSADELRQIGTNYVQATRRMAPTAERIVDKMPGNFSLTGLINLVLPNARIIHACRDPRDTAFSCFSLQFAVSHEYTYDLADLGRFYCGYARLMEHWRAVLPDGAMLEVQYEELVADLEHHARRIVAYCGLEWDDACLAFHKTERSVRTASAAQVRQPIYQSSIGRWRPHEARLQPLLRELTGLIPSSLT